MRAISQKRARSPDPGRSLGERREAYRRALVGGTIPFIRRIDHELAVVVADLVQRALPERGAGDGAVAERELHGLESWASSVSGVIISYAVSGFAIAP